MSKLRIVGLAACGGVIGSYVNYKYQDNKRQPLSFSNVPPPQLMVAGVNVLPLSKAMFGMLPASLRSHLLLSVSAPASDHVPRDTWELQHTSPYTLDQVNNKVWRVEYERENHAITKKLYRDVFMGMLGLDMNNEENAARVMQGAEQFGREVSAQAHRDIARFKNMNFDTVDPSTHHTRENMIIVQLNSGGLLLYCPVKIHDDTEFGKFLRDLGPVEYIVAPSSEHNLQLPAVIKKYPGAKIVATKLNETKLKMVDALPRGKIDYDYTNTEQLSQLNNVLRDEGVNMTYINGDVSTNALFVVAHRVALECDIVYTHDDGEGFLMMDKTEFRALEEDSVMWRLFKFRLLSRPNSPNGFLPPYRYWAMDPHCLWPMILTTPAEDGSSASSMASSLRSALSQEFDEAVGVHFRHMSAEKFRRSVDANWNWLDGESLLPNPK